MTSRSSAAPRLRLARTEEVAALSELCFRSKAVWGYDAAFMALARDTLRVEPAQIADGNVWLAVAADGGIAGMVELAPGEPPDTLDLSKLFVEPQWIGAGFGRALLRQAAAEARRRGAKRLTILADPNAAGFYESCGARRVGEAPSDAIPGRFLPLYELPLDQTRA